MNTHKKTIFAGLLMSILLAVSLPLAAQATPSLTDALTALPDAELFNEALVVTGVGDTLGREAHTVFVPFDTEFGAILSAFDVDMAALQPDEPKMRLLRAIVQQHILVGTLTSEQFQAGQIVTLQGSKLTFQTIATGFTVNQQRVGASVAVTGGALHRVRATLMPDLCSGIAVSGSIGARLGPSFDRARIGFLPAGVPVPITGQWTDTYGDIWYRLDKTIATPNKQAAEIWTLGENMTVSGIACDLIANVTPA